MVRSMALDHDRFSPTQSPTGKGRWYHDRITGDAVPRSQAIKLSQGLSHSAIARQNKLDEIAKHGHRIVEFNRAWRSTYGSTQIGDYQQARSELEGLWDRRHETPPDDWEEWADDWSLDDEIDWDEFFADSPSAE